MKRLKTLCLTIIALFLIQLGLSQVFRGQQANPPDMQGRFSELTLTLSSTKANFVQLEPIPFIISLQNQTDKPIMGHKALDFSLNHVEVYTRNQQEETTRVPDLSLIRNLLVVHDNPILPDQGYSTTQLLELDLARVFPQTGTYQLKVVIGNANWSETVESNYITVNILAPQGIDRKAFDYIKKSSYAEFLYGADVTNDAKYRQELEQFASKFSESVYGNYATFLLAKYYFYSGQNEKAYERFDRLAKKPNFVYAEKVREYLTKLENKSNGQ
jgi:hypothetical protein